MASDLQRTQNAQNALLSTGPSSPGGKAISAGNSRKHGLSGRRLVIDPARADEARELRARYLDELQPATAEGVEAVDVMVAMTFRIDDCRAALVDLAIEQADEADTDWDHARKLDAEAVAESLRRRPGTASARLAETKQGTELMLGRWESLRRSLEMGTWDDADRSSALDLLGVDRSFRKPGQTALDAPEGRDATAHVRLVIDQEMGRLRSRLATVLARSDERSRDRAGTPLGVLLSKPAALILRYEREAERRYNAARRAARASSQDGAAVMALDPVPDFTPPPAPRPVPVPAPPAVAVSAPAAPARPLNRRARRAEAARLRKTGR